MPFKSKAQRRKFAELLVDGKITDEAYERWNQTTGRKILPERLHPESKKKPSSRKKPSPRKRRPASKRSTPKKAARTR
jgi:hypothetical protein